MLYIIYVKEVSNYCTIKNIAVPLHCQKESTAVLNTSRMMSPQRNIPIWMAWHSLDYSSRHIETIVNGEISYRYNRIER